MGEDLLDLVKKDNQRFTKLSLLGTPAVSQSGLLTRRM
jgi:hypothetical protein